MIYIWAKNRHETWRNERKYVIFSMFDNFQHLATIEHNWIQKWLMILIYMYGIALDEIYFIYQYPFGIRMCSMLAKCWTLSEVANIVYFCSFYWLWVLINPHSTNTTPNQYSIQIFQSFPYPKNDKMLMLAKISFLTIFPIFAMEISYIKFVGQTFDLGYFSNLIVITCFCLYFVICMR